MKELDVLDYAMTGAAQISSRLHKYLLKETDEKKKEFYRDCINSVWKDEEQMQKRIDELKANEVIKVK